MTRSRIYLIVIVMLLAGLACAVPAIPMDEDTFNTAVAQTVMVGLTEKYISPTFTSSPTITFTPSVTPVPPTETPTSPATITPTFPFTPTITDTFAVPEQKLIVTVNTNCRTGPDKSFHVEGTLLKGESTTVYGIDPSGRYFYIRNPDPGLEYCWLSGKYATIGGAVSRLTVMTALPTFTPTPTSTLMPGFNLIYSSLQYCGDWWVNLELVNTGKVAFQSVVIKLKEPFKGRTLSLGANGFSSVIGCSPTSTVEDVLEPGASVFVSSPAVDKDPVGKKMDITVSVCTELDGEGICVVKALTFKP